MIIIMTMTMTMIMIVTIVIMLNLIVIINNSYKIIDQHPRSPEIKIILSTSSGHPKS